MKNPFVLCLMSFVLAGTAGAAATLPNFPLGAHIYMCRVENAYGEPATEEDGLTVKVSNKEREVLRCVSVGNRDENGINCSVDINLSSQGSATTAKPGDEVTFAVYEGDGLIGIADYTLPVGDAAAVSLVRLTSESEDFYEYNSDLYGDESGMVRLPCEYIDARYVPWTEYNPDGDSDDDGMPNYAEYVAGTEPQNAADCLRFTSCAVDMMTTALTFTYHYNRTYTLMSADSLTNGTPWSVTKFRKSADGQTDDLESECVSGEEDGKIREMTIYLKRPQALKKFYRIKVQQ